MTPSCIAMGLVASQYGIVWAMCINGVRVSLSFWAPLFATMSTISLLRISVCAQTLWMIIFLLV